MLIRQLLTLGTTIFYTMTLGFVAQAQEIIFPVQRPAYSERSHQTFLRARSSYQPGTILGATKCPKQALLISNIVDRISKSNGIEEYVKISPGLIIDMACAYPGITQTAIGRGGIMSITGGLIGRVGDEDQLAFAVAHEMAHFLLAHDEKQIFMEQNNLPYENEWPVRERAADLVGLKLMVVAGYDPQASLDVMDLFLSTSGLCLYKNYFCNDKPNGTHPPFAERKAYLLDEIKRLNLRNRPRITSQLLNLARKEWRDLQGH